MGIMSHGREREFREHIGAIRISGGADRRSGARGKGALKSKRRKRRSTLPVNCVVLKGDFSTGENNDKAVDVIRATVKPAGGLKRDIP